MRSPDCVILVTVLRGGWCGVVVMVELGNLSYLGKYFE